MPKVNLKLESSLDKAAKNVHRIARSKLSVERLSKLMGYKRCTDFRRLQNPEDFTLRELRILYRAADVSDEMFMEMIRTKADNS